MKKRLMFFILCLVMIILISSSPTQQQTDLSLGQDLQKITKKVTANGWVYFNDNFKPDPYEFFSDYKSAFSLSKYDEMRLTKEGKDSIFNYFRFERYYKGILVEGSGKSLKYKKENLQVVIGRPLIKIEIDLNSIIDPNIAFGEAKENVNALKYAWEDPNWESTIKKETNDSIATFYPKADLVITQTSDGIYRLAYKFNIISILPKFDNSVQYIDAQNGTFIKALSLEFNGTSPCITWYNGEKIITDYFAQGHWWLEDHTRGMIIVKSCVTDDGDDFDGLPYLEDWDDYWDWVSERSEVSAMWAVQRSYDYFNNIFSWTGLNDNNRYIRIGTEYPYNQSGMVIWPNRYYDYMFFGYRNGHSLTALDIVAHEYTHGVIYYLNGLQKLADECGALNESFSDFFGERIEEYATGIPCDWIFGADVDTIRSFISPSYRNQPDYYHGDRWSYSGDADTYMHINSGVPNHMFYLLSEGDSEHDITGIGISLASTIAFHALDWYLESDASFAEARNAFLDVALNYGDECYYVYKDVMNAWATVGVGDPAPDPCISSVYISGPSTVCPSSTEFTITDLPSGFTINWTCSENITRISNQGSNPCQFEANVSGENGWIDATISYNGNQYGLDQRNVWVGSDLPDPEYIEIKGENYEFVEHTNDYWELCPNTIYLLQAHSSSSVSQWDWTIPESWEMLSNENSPEVLIQTGDYILWEDEVQVDVYNYACGTWIYYADYLLVTEPPYGCGELLKFNLYPNPATSTLTLQINENELTRENTSNYNISIVDKFGRVTINKITKGNLHNLDISNLPNGEYTVVISKGRIVKSQRFIKSN